MEKGSKDTAVLYLLGIFEEEPGSTTDVAHDQKEVCRLPKIFINLHN